MVRLENGPIIGVGGHSAEPGACVMEWVSLILNGEVKAVETAISSTVPPVLAWALEVNWLGDTKVEGPECTDHIVTSMAIEVNDYVATPNRQLMIDLIPRLLRAKNLEDSPKYESVWMFVLERMWEHYGEKRQLRRVPWSEKPIDVVTAELLLLLRSGHYQMTKKLEELLKGHCRDDLSRIDFLSNLLGYYEKALVEVGEAASDPEDDYISDEELDRIITAMKAVATPKT